MPYKQTNPRLKMYLKEFEATNKYMIALGPSSTHLAETMKYSVPSITKTSKDQMSRAQLKKIKPGQNGNPNWLFKPQHYLPYKLHYDQNKRYFKMNGLWTVQPHSESENREDREKEVD